MLTILFCACSLTPIWVETIAIPDVPMMCRQEIHLGDNAPASTPPDDRNTYHDCHDRELGA